jgi:hypothetical protein
VFRTRDVVIGAAIVAATGLTAITAANHRSDPQDKLRRDREAVQAVANRLTYQTISDAWTQSKLANPAPLDRLERTIPLRHVGTHDEPGGAIILSFAGHNAACIDLISTPTGNLVQTRRC